MTTDTTAAASRGQADDDDRWRLLDERDFLRRSLEDATLEHEAGDLSDEDYEVLVARDSARLADVEAAVAALGAPSAAPDTAEEHAGHAPDEAERVPMSVWRKVGIVVACAFIALGAGILVAHFVHSRQPGQASSGSVSVSQAQRIEQQLQQAVSHNNRGDTAGALELYNAVLSEDPSNPAALAGAGWLQWSAGQSAHVASLERLGRAEIVTAVKNAPSYFLAHLFYGLVLENQDHNHAAAVAQFNDFLADGAPAGEARQVAPQVAVAYQEAGLAVPAAFSARSTSTSAP
jgi:hypothetical protein